MGHEAFDSLTIDLINTVSQEENKKHNKKDDDQSDPPNYGKIQVDATVADQYITYPMNNGLLNQSRKKLGGVID